MLTYNMDTRPDSVWLRTTPGDAALAQPFRCTEAGLFYARERFSTARSSKNSYILFYTVKGAGLIEQGDTTVLLTEGQALLLNCRFAQSYCTAPGYGQWHHYWVHLDGSGVQAIDSVLNAQRLTAVNLPELNVRDAFATILQQIEQQSMNAILQQSFALHTILHNMARQRLAATAMSSNRQLVQDAAQHLQANYTQDLCLDQLVQAAHVSKSYFLRLFRQYMGTTPYNFLLCCRITAAKELLVTTDLPVSQIATAVGFGNEANFSTRFAKMAGQSPLQYRKSVTGVAF